MILDIYGHETRTKRAERIAVKNNPIDGRSHETAELDWAEVDDV